MSQPLTINSPFIFRLEAWFIQRFPFAELPLYVFFYFAVVLVSRVQSGNNEIYLYWLDLFGCIALWSFFLCLRIFDEHMDYESDCQSRPDFILQKGFVTLLHLKIIAIIALGFQLILSVYADDGIGTCTLLWGTMLFWHLLAANNFFCGDWFNRHLTHHALAHYASMPLITYWLAHLGSSGATFEDTIFQISILSFTTALLYELIRKTLAKEDERALHDTYSNVLGLPLALLVIWMLMSATLLLTAEIVRTVKSELSLIDYLIFSGIFAITSIRLLRFLFSPTTRGFKRNRLLIGALIVTVNCLIVVSLFIAHPEILSLNQRGMI